MKDTLSTDTFSARGRQRLRPRGDNLVLFAFLFISCALMVFSRLDLEPVRWLRWSLVSVVAPVLEIGSAPVGRARQASQQITTYVDALTEIERLRMENQRLRGWEWRAKELERKLAQVSALARASEEIGLDFVSARVIADTRGPFANSVIVNLGVRDGVRAGFAAVSGDGLVGHVIDVDERAARVLLLSDATSRVPVIVGPAMTRAILKGDGSLHPRLNHIGGTAPGSALPAGTVATPGLALRAGDDVLTSGDEGLLPRGLKIGTVQAGDDGTRVALAAQIHGTDVLGILFFSPPGIGTGSDTAGALQTTQSRGKVEPTPGRRRSGAPSGPSP